jgi:hypothetical protein
MATPSGTELQDLTKKVDKLVTAVATAEKHYGEILTLLTNPDAKLLSDHLRAAYSERGNQIRHFSTIRSALTVFLVTAGMTAYSGYQDKKSLFLFWASNVFVFASVVVCWWFSRKTERQVLRYKDTWKVLTGKQTIAVLTRDLPKAEFRKRMKRDLMNWLLIASAIGFLAYAWWSWFHPAPPVAYYPWE